MVDQRVPQWYAFVTRPRHEKRVHEHLQKAGLTSYLPLRKSLNQWRDRKKWVEVPLFSCYIFSYISYVDRYEVLKVPSVVRIVGFDRKPMPVRESEIEAIKTILRTGNDIDVVDGFLPGDRVKIKSGPLAGFEAEPETFRSASIDPQALWPLEQAGPCQALTAAFLLLARPAAS